MMKRYLLATSLLALGCSGGEGPAQLEVQMLSVTGELEGRTLDPSAYTQVSGERFGDQGTFFVDGPTASMQLAACPLGDLNVDPYGSGVEGGEGPRPVPVPDDAGRSDPSTIGSVDCLGRGLSICDAAGCAGFAAEDVDIQIVEQNGWRRVVFDASNGTGDVLVELLYRERH